MALDIGVVLDMTAASLVVVIFVLVRNYNLKMEDELWWVIAVISLMLVLDIIRGVLGFVLAWPQAIFWAVALVVYLRYPKKTKN